MTNNKGRLHDILVEDGMVDGLLTVWADPGMKDIISSIPGVSWCSNEHEQSTKYDIGLDPRYDAEWVKNEIIARVKIKK
jgi:hypothetical protein